jgi:hypothetical protein
MAPKKAPKHSTFITLTEQAERWIKVTDTPKHRADSPVPVFEVPAPVSAAAHVSARA